MMIQFQGMENACDLGDSQVRAACFAVNNHGTNDHPMADVKTLQYFFVDYVIGCLSKLVVAGEANSRTDAAITTLDKIRNAHNAARKGESA